MDFSIDGSSDIESSESVVEGIDENELLSKEENEQLKLQELKEQLLVERNHLINNIDKLKQSISINKRKKMKSMQVKNLDSNSNNLLLDLMLTSKKNINQDDDSITKPEPIQKIDGISSVQKELLHKVDTLPLLNIDLRLQYLHDYLFNNVDVQIISNDLENNDIINLTVSFYFKNSNLLIHINIKYDQIFATLEEFNILSVSDNHKLNLTPIVEKCNNNPNLFLFFCFEYDKLINKRNEILIELINEIKKRVMKFEHVNNKETLIFFNQVLQDDAELAIIKLEINYSIKFKDSNSGFSLPCTKITQRLWKNDELISNNNDIMNSLMKEYGVLDGLKEYSKSCLFPNTYSNQ